MADCEHVFFLVHGLHGTESDFSTVEKDLKIRFPAAHFFRSACNEGFKTQDGVDIGGRRLAEEIEKKFASLEVDPSHRPKFSIIGHSLGGIYSRCAIGNLYKNGFFEKVTPVSYISIATPHLGSRRPSFLRQKDIAKPFSSFVRGTASFVARMVIGKSGRHLMLEDKDGANGEPLLVDMSRHDGPYIQGLQRFQNCLLVSNVHKDFQVPYCTAAILSDSPYSPTTKWDKRDSLVVGYSGFTPSYEAVITASNYVALRPKEFEGPSGQESQVVKCEDMAHDIEEQELATPNSSAGDHHSLRELGSWESPQNPAAPSSPPSVPPPRLSLDTASHPNEAMFVVDQRGGAEAETEAEKSPMNQNKKFDGVYVPDRDREIEYSPFVLENLQTAVSWRRIDFELSSWFCHDVLIQKSLFGVFPDPKPGQRVSHLLASVLALDHGLGPELRTGD